MHNGRCLRAHFFDQLKAGQPASCIGQADLQVVPGACRGSAKSDRAQAQGLGPLARLRQNALNPLPCQLVHFVRSQCFQGMQTPSGFGATPGLGPQGARDRVQ